MLSAQRPQQSLQQSILGGSSSVLGAPGHHSSVPTVLPRSMSPGGGTPHPGWGPLLYSDAHPFPSMSVCVGISFFIFPHQFFFFFLVKDNGNFWGTGWGTCSLSSREIPVPYG